MIKMTTQVFSLVRGELRSGGTLLSHFEPAPPPAANDASYWAAPSS